MKRKRRRPKIKTATAEGGQFFPGVQKKLAVGTPGDAFEVEADKMADTVVNGTEGSSIQKMESEEEIQQKPLLGSISSVQKKDMPSEEETVQQKGQEEETVQQKGQEEETIQKKGSNADGMSLNIEDEIRHSKGQGNKMDHETQQMMEQGFGSNFSDVNIHTDDRSEKLSNALGAQAFTTGNDVFFNKGKYNPNSKEGQHLLAHELTHTIQQGAGKTAKNIQKQDDPNPNIVPFRGSFYRELQIPFRSTTERPNVRITINHRAIQESGPPCTEFFIRIDDGTSRASSRTLTRIPTSTTETTTVLSFTMQNATRHNLYLFVPGSCRDTKAVKVNGTIHRTS